MATFHFEADDLDAESIHRAIAVHQAGRIDGEHILPDGDSDTMGAVLAEICRDWIEYREAWKPDNQT